MLYVQKLLSPYTSSTRTPPSSTEKSLVSKQHWYSKDSRPCISDFRAACDIISRQPLMMAQAWPPNKFFPSFGDRMSGCTWCAWQHFWRRDVLSRPTGFFPFPMAVQSLVVLPVMTAVTPDKLTPLVNTSMMMEAGAWPYAGSTHICNKCRACFKPMNSCASPMTGHNRHFKSNTPHEILMKHTIFALACANKPVHKEWVL